MEKVKNVDIAGMTAALLEAADNLTDDPYLQMTALRSAASLVENRLGAYAVKAGVTAALANIAKGG